MDAFTVLVLAVGAGAAAAVTRARRYRDPWNLMSLATAQYRLQVRADDGVLGGGTRAEVDRLADEHFDGTLEGVTLGDLFPALCSPHWEAATAVMLGCLIRNHRIPRGFRPPSFDQYELLRAYWVPRPSRRRTYDTPRTARDYLHLANTYAALPVEAEDGAIERVPADWFRGYLTSQECHADKAPISVLLRALEPNQNSPTWRQDAANARRCITGRLKREAVLHPEFDDETPDLQPDEFATALWATPHHSTGQVCGVGEPLAPEQGVLRRHRPGFDGGGAGAGR